MRSYLDFEVHPDAEFSVNLLLGELYERVHLALVRRRQGDIAVSFPRMHGSGLGEMLRLHGSSASLEEFGDSVNLRGISDWVSRRAVSDIPAEVDHRRLRRVQAKSSPERLRRRLMRRHGIDARDAAKQIPDAAAQSLSLPFIVMRSSSTKQRFRLFLEVGPAEPEPIAGDFNTYGLSGNATVPHF